MACTTYVNDIFEYLRESEVRPRIAEEHGARSLMAGAAAFPSIPGRPLLPPPLLMQVSSGGCPGPLKATHAAAMPVDPGQNIRCCLSR